MLLTDSRLERLTWRPEGLALATRIEGDMMSLFESIKNAIFGHGAAAGATSGSAGSPAAGSSGTATAGAASAGGTSAPTRPSGPTGTPNVQPPAAAATTPPLSQGTLESQLSELSAKNSQKLNWQTSIVDLMKLVGLDPSLANRKLLAQELGYTGDTADSASMNIWLHKAVMDKLAESGGKVPPALKTT